MIDQVMQKGIHLGLGPGLCVLALVVLVAAPRAAAWTPAAGHTYLNKVTVEAPCNTVDKAQDTRWRGYDVLTADPKRAAGIATVTPAALPRAEVMADGIVDDFSMHPFPEALVGLDPAGCTKWVYDNDTEISGDSVILGRPGPYVFMKFDQQTHFDQIDENTDDPTPTKCANNDNAYFPFAVGSPPDEALPGKKWVVSSFCNLTEVIPFNVEGDTGICPTSGDMSEWPTSPYINQYDVGSALDLPIRFGVAGGNASGPAALLMALLDHPSPILPPLTTVFDATMQRTRAQISSTEVPNNFSSGRAVAYLHSLGFRGARFFRFGTSAAEANSENIQDLYLELLVGGSLLAKTSFGPDRWGQMGGGGMIVVSGIRKGDFVVDDPAGNYFSDPVYHYGGGECAFDVTYPLAWMKPAIMGNWMIRIGDYNPVTPRAQFETAAEPAAVTASHGASILVEDTNAESADNAQSFYLQDAEGRRAGWIDGSTVEEIPDSSAWQEPPGWTETSNGDADLDPDPGTPPAHPRSIAVANPAAGLTLHVVADDSAPYALSLVGYADGQVVGTDSLTGAGNGGDVVLPSTALAAVAGATPPPNGGGSGSASSPTPTAGAAPTGRRSAALKKCKRKKTASARKKCKQKATLLPV